MSDDIRKLNEDVNTLITTYRSKLDEVDAGLKDVVRTSELKAMEAELTGKLKEVNDTLAALNTPSIETSVEENIERAKEDLADYFRNGAEHGVKEYVDGVQSLRFKDVSLNVAAEGGVFLPKIFSGVMTDILRKHSPIRGLSTVVRAKQNYVHPIKTGGGTGKTRAEKGSISSSSTLAFDLLNFVPIEFYDEQAATHWAHDGDASVDLIGMVLNDVLAGIGEKESEAFILGTTNNTMAAGNVAMGLCALTMDNSGTTRFSNDLGKLSGVATAAEDVITFDDIMTLRSLLHSSYLNRATYMMSAAAELQLLKLKNDNNDYILTAGDVTSGIPNTILGNPYVVCDYVPDPVADNKPVVVLGDFSKYVIADASDIRWTVDPISDKTVVKYLGRRRSAAALTDFQAFRALFNKPAA